MAEANITLRLRADTRGANDARTAVQRVADEVRRVQTAAAAPVRLQVVLDDRALTDALSRIRKLRQELSQPIKVAVVTAQPVAPAAQQRQQAQDAQRQQQAQAPVKLPNTARAEQEIQRLAAVQARAAVTAGDYARASTILTGALGQVGNGSVSAARLQEQLGRVQAQQSAAQERQARAATAAGRSARQNADSEIAAARASGEHARALQVINAQLDAAGAGTTRYNQLLAQKARAERAAASETARTEKQLAAQQRKQGDSGDRALPRTFAGFTPGGLAQAAGAFGLATIGPELVGSAVRGAADAAKASLDLQRTQNVTKALAGDQRTYNQVVEAARQQQKLYGGTLQENIQGLSGLVIASRSSGAELQSLIGLSQRLAVLDPSQGAEGARIALSEALAGDPRSLALRYEIPRSALEKLKDESLSAAERLGVLDQYLNKIGISADVAGGSVTTQAQAFNALGAELDTFRTNVGAGLADAFTGAATGLERLLGAINGNPEAVAQLRAILGGRSTVTEEEIGQASEDVSRQKSRELLGVNRRGVVGQAQQQLGTEGLKEAIERSTRLRVAGDAAAQGIDALNRSFQAGDINAATYLTRLSDLERQTGLTTQAGAATTAVLSQAYASGAIGLDAFDAATGRVAVSTAAAGAAQQQAVAAVVALDEAQRAKLVGDAEAAGQAERVLAIQNAITNTSDAVVKGFLTEADGAAILQKQFGFTADEAERLFRARIAASGAGGVTEDRAERTTTARDRNEVRTALDEKNQRTEEARRRQIRETGTQAQRTALAEKELADARRQYGANSAEAIDAETNLRRARTAATARASSTGIDTATRADLALTNDLVKQRDILLERQRQLVAGSNEWKRVTGQILDLDEKIATQQERQARAAVDARIGEVQDRQKRRDEDQRIAQAQRILGDASTSAEQKAAARDVLELIPLERERREIDLAKQQREAQGASVVFENGSVQVLIDGKPVEARIVTNFRGAVAQAGAQGAA
jgi:hypothetical protein